MGSAFSHEPRTSRVQAMAVDVLSMVELSRLTSSAASVSHSGSSAVSYSLGRGAG